MLLWLMGPCASVQAQVVGNPDDARFRFGPVALAPSFAITNLGRDSNIFNESDEANPQGDMTAVISPAVEGWLQTPRFRLSGRGRLDYNYYRELTPFRALDMSYFGRGEVPLNRLVPFVEASWVKSHQQNFEIDSLDERRVGSLSGGTAIRLTSKTFVDVYVNRAHEEYDDAFYRGVDLAETLTYDTNLGGTAVRYEITPLTTFSVSAEWSRDSFVDSPERDSETFILMPSVEFKPLALVSGHARVGFRHTNFYSAVQPDFDSTVVYVDLQYVWRSRTQFSFGIQRDLEYSYLETQYDYVLIGMNFGVTQRLGTNWDVRGNVGRYNLDYRRPPFAAPTTAVYPSETVLSLGGDVGYHLGRKSRIGLAVNHSSRTSDMPLGRGYDRLRIGSSFTYGF
jgi:hypothetical protein